MVVTFTQRIYKLIVAGHLPPITVLLWIIGALLFSPTRSFAQAKPGTAAQYYESGEEAYRKNNLRMALAHFNEAIRLEPFLRAAYFSRGQTRERLGDAKGAITDFNIFLESNPQHAEALFHRGTLRYENGQWAIAREDFLKLLGAPAGATSTVYFQTDKASRVNNIFTVQNDIRPTCLNYLGLIDIKLAKYHRAIFYFDSALALAPKFTDGLVHRGLSHLHLRDTSKALNDFKRALEIAPDHATAQHNIAVLTGFTGNLRETERLLTKAIEEKPDLPYSYTERGHVRFRQQNYRGALADFDRALTLDPHDADDWLSRGLAKQKLNDLPGAVNDFTQAIKIKSDFEKAWLCRGNLLLKMNRVNEAIEDYGLAIFHYPEYGTAYYNRALAFHKIGNLKEACRDMMEAQRLSVKIQRKVLEAVCK